VWQCSGAPGRCSVMPKVWQCTGRQQGARVCHVQMQVRQAVVAARQHGSKAKRCAEGRRCGGRQWREKCSVAVVCVRWARGARSGVAGRWRAAPVALSRFPVVVCALATRRQACRVCS